LVTLTPKPGTTTEQMLDIKLRFENYTDAHTFIIAIKDVYLGGPAHHSGLQPFKDFILGTKELTFTDMPMFAKYLAVNKNQEVQLVVYNVQKELVRRCTIVPSDSWGSPEQGLIGAEVCMGLLTQISKRRIDEERDESGSRMRSIFSKITKEAPATLALAQQKSSEVLERE